MCLFPNLDPFSEVYLFALSVSLMSPGWFNNDSAAPDVCAFKLLILPHLGSKTSLKNTQA